MRSRSTHSWARASWFSAATCLIVGCGSSGVPVMQDAGADGPTQLTLAVSVNMPALDGLVVTQGEIELERLGLVGDAQYDDRTQVPHATFLLGAPAQSFAFSMAAPGLYSRLRTEIEHVEIFGSWRGTPLHVQTAGDERVVDIRGPDEELSPTQAAPFALVIDGTQWLTVEMLDGATQTSSGIEIDEHVAPDTIDDLMASVTSSFSLSMP